MSTCTELNINPRNDYYESRNDSYENNTNIGESCQNNENAFPSGHKPSNTTSNNRNSDMKTDRPKMDNDHTTMPNDVLIENKNAYNLQHSKTACNEAKNNLEAAKDILLQPDDIKQGYNDIEECKSAEIRNLDVNNKILSNDFPVNEQRDSRTIKNVPAKTKKENLHDAKSTEPDKTLNGQYLNGHVNSNGLHRNNVCKDRNEVPESNKINTASIRKTEEAHSKSSDMCNKGSISANSKLRDDVLTGASVNVSSVETKLNAGLEKTYDTTTIKEELNSLKEELKRQINEGASKKEDSSCIVETATKKDGPPVSHEKPNTPSTNSDGEAKLVPPLIPSTTAVSPKTKKKKIKGKLTKSKKKESTPARDLLQPETEELLLEVNSVPEVSPSENTCRSNDSKTSNLEDKDIEPCSVSVEPKSNHEENAERNISNSAINIVTTENNLDNLHAPDVMFVAENTSPKIHSANHYSTSNGVEQIPACALGNKGADEGLVQENKLNTEQGKFCTNLINQFIATEEIANGVSLDTKVKETSNKETFSPIDDSIHSNSSIERNCLASSFIQKEDITDNNIYFVEKENSVNHQNSIEKTDATPTPIKVKDFIQNTNNENENSLQRPSAFLPRRNSTSTHNISQQLQQQSKSLDEDDTDDEYIHSENYKTSRSQSMAVVDFRNAPNHNRVPARWQGSNFKSSSKFSSNFDTIINEEPVQKLPADVPKKSSCPIKEYDKMQSTANKVPTKSLVSRSDSMNSSDLRDFKRSLSRTRPEDKTSSDRMRSAERKEQRITGVTPATAYQQYTFARSKTSLNMNSYGGKDQHQTTPQNADTNMHRSTMSPPKAPETKTESKIPARYLKRMQHTTSVNEKLPPSVPSTSNQPASSSYGKSNISSPSVGNEQFIPSATDSALQAKIKQAKLEHSFACQDAKNYERHSSTLPTTSTSPPRL